MGPRPCCIAFVLLSTLAADAVAQDSAQPPNPARFATEIVVTPERGDALRALVPAATVVLDAAAIVERPLAHPGEITSFLPGFTVARPDFHAGRPVLSARGFFGGGEAEYVRLLVDGNPVMDVESGLIDWSAISLASVERVEAVKGPGASLYGDSAIGGVIQLFTARLRSGASVTASAGSFGSVVADGSYGRRRDGFGVTLSGAGRRTGGAFEHSGGREIVASAGVDGTSGRLIWRWSASADDRVRDDPGAQSRDALQGNWSASDPLYALDGVDRRGFTTRASLRTDRLPLRPQARVHLSLRDEELMRTILLAPGLGDRRARDLRSLAVGGSLEAEHAFLSPRAAVLRAGVDLARENLDTRYRDVGPEGQVGAITSRADGFRMRTGLFISSFVDPVASVRLSGGLRWDDVSDDGFTGATAQRQRAWSPRGGVVVRLDDSGDLLLFGQVSKAFKVPTLDQRFDPRPYPDFMGGTFTISTPGLKPQRATNIEVGVNGGGPVRWSAVAYRITVDDEIDFDVRTFSYANIGRSRHTGFEVDAEGRWRRVRPSISYGLSRVVDAGGERQLKNVPRHAVRAAAHFDLGRAVTTYVSYQRTAGAFLDDENVFAIDGRSALDLRIRRSFGRHALFVDVLNLTNDRYEEYGFTLADFSGGTVPYAYPGAGRAARAGVTLSF
jgi:outer membrane receptor protein involved in Fe transport